MAEDKEDESKYVVTVEYLVDVEHHIAPHDLNTKLKPFSKEARAEAIEVAKAHYHPALYELNLGEKFSDHISKITADEVAVRIGGVEEFTLEYAETDVRKLKNKVIEVLDLLEKNMKLYEQFKEIDVVLSKYVDRLVDAATDEYFELKGEKK